MTPNQCRSVLCEFLRKRVATDYILLDLPYFANVGDVLIWQSTLDILAELPYKCLYAASIESYQHREIDKNTVILFMGGGNFGDLWKRHQLFRQRVLQEYPLNPIVQLPQSVFFSDKEFLHKDVSLFSQHQGDITLCARDQRSYEFFATYYPDSELELLPDMVLSLNIKRYIKPVRGNGTLYVKRDDTEKSSITENIIPCDAVIGDWPTMEAPAMPIKAYDHISGYLKWIDNHFGLLTAKSFADICYKNYFKNYIIQSGLRFVNAYAKVFSTRLHVGVVAALLGKDTVMFDNSYGKIKGVYDLWMKDWKCVRML